MTTIHAPRGALRPPRRRDACIRALRAVPLLALLGGCDLPTGLPKWDTSWLVPSKSTTLGVAQLLPANVSVAGDASAFLVNVGGVNFSRSLGELCTQCTALAGLTAPKPAFSAVLADSMSMPANVTGGTLASGTVSLAISNNLGFDPIRPAASGARGSLVVTLTSGGRTLGTLTLDGSADAVPSGQTTTRAIQLSAGAVGSRLTVSVAVTSPLGDAVRIDPNQRLTITATPQAVRFSDASVAISQKSVSLTPQTLDLTDIDQSIIDRVREPNALVLTISNPFGVTGTLNVTFQNAAMPISKQIQLPATTGTQRVPFTRDEMRAILGRMVTLTATGTVNAASAVKVTPSQVVKIDTQIELTLGPKEG